MTAFTGKNADNDTQYIQAGGDGSSGDPHTPLIDVGGTPTATIKTRDANGNVIYMAGTGSGTSGAPYVQVVNNG